MNHTCYNDIETFHNYKKPSIWLRTIGVCFNFVFINNNWTLGIRIAANLIEMMACMTCKQNDVRGR